MLLESGRLVVRYFVAVRNWSSVGSEITNSDPTDDQTFESGRQIFRRCEKLVVGWV